MRSAEAANNTSNLIENTIKAVQNGNELTKSTQEAFKDNISISGKISQLVDEIATASQEQAHGIAQINHAVSEMDKNIQQAAGNAEESASVSADMKAQVDLLKNSVEELMSLIDVDASVEASVRIGPVTVISSKSDKVHESVMIHEGRRAPITAQKKDLKRKSPPAEKKAVRPDQVIPFDDGGFKDF
jgi:uncharacterized phage infection (PIP) family protein YhgE